MNSIKRISILFFLFITCNSYSQGFLLTLPRVIFDGSQLLIFYDIITNNPDDQFYVWVEIKRTNGEGIEARNISGDVGNYVKPGNSKKIVWNPGKDSIYLDEEINVEVKAEKYVKAFKKGSMIIRSMILPGWGQTKISKGKPWWLTGLVFYGTIAGGYLYYNNYHKNFESYRIEDDEKKRSEFLKQAQQELNYSLVFAYSGAALWGINVVWVMATPNRYQVLHHGNLSLKCSPATNFATPLITLRLEF